MKIDMHFHVAGNGKDISRVDEDVYFNPDDNNLFFTRVLYNGSDFPILIDGWAHLPYVTADVDIEEYILIQKTKNPLDKDVRIKRACDFPDSIIEGTDKVLRLG